MKDIFSICRLLSAVAAAAAACVSVQVQAGLQVPFVVNDNTLHLWHFDGPFTNANGTTNVITTDAVATSSITLTNLGLPTAPEGGPVSYTNISLGNPSFAGLGNALRITQRNAFANGGSFPDTTPFINPSSGAFTFEALVRPTVNPLAAPNNMEIVCADNQAGPRGWQFRIRDNANLQFQTITPGGQDFNAPLPNSGLNAALANQWYHVAVTYTGDSPTNSDPAGVLKFYWTLLDTNRSHADQLGSDFFMGTRPGGAPVLGIGGSGRTQTGVANGEGFIGFIDEVRISNIALNSNEMAFVTGGSLNPPQFTQQPPTNVVVAFNGTLSLATLVSGTLPITYQWQHNGGGGGFTNLTGQTDSVLAISNVPFSAAGQYRLLATNNFGGATSVVAQVTVGAAPSELFGTGVDPAGAPLSATSPGNPDLHYQLTFSSDDLNLGPNTIVWGDGAPLAPNGVFAANGPLSGWIGPQMNAGQATGKYVYRTSFVIDGAVPSTVAINGLMWVNTAVQDVLLNGVSTGISDFIDTAEKFSFAFQITNGFVAGVNTLDFVATNSNGSFNGFRADLSGVGQALPPGVPVVQTDPPSVTVRENGQAKFSVVALGRPPLTYQWYGDNTPLPTTLLPDATNRTLTLNPVFTGGQASNFRVVISNASGSITSAVASLTLTTNRPPVPPVVNVTATANTPLDIPITTLVYGATDADLDPISFFSVDPGTTAGGSVVQNGINLNYTPPTDFTGADTLTYNLTDQLEFPQGVISITVNPAAPQQPGISSVSISGSNLIISGTNAPASGNFVLLSSTNAALPVAQWIPELTNAWDGTGLFSITNPITPVAPQRFYLLQLQ